jgi:hypothetical protein
MNKGIVFAGARAIRVGASALRYLSTPVCGGGECRCRWSDACRKGARPSLSERLCNLRVRSQPMRGGDHYCTDNSWRSLVESFRLGETVVVCARLKDRLPVFFFSNLEEKRLLRSLTWKQ